MRTPLTVVLLLPAACAQDAVELGDAAEQAAWLDAHAAAPVDYVTGCFARHDVVLLGEHHLIRDNVEFVADLIPALDAAGVRVLVSEFVRSAQNADVERLVTAAEFDVGLGIAILRELPSPIWGHREYLDVLRAVHAVNRGKREGEARFVVLGLDSDWRQVERLRESGSAGFAANLARETHMVDVVEREVLAKELKALVHVGWAHTVTAHGARLGTVLRQRHGERVFQTALHHDLAPAITARIESLCGGRAGGVGFDVVGSPLAAMREPAAMPFRMVRGATFATLVEGLVFVRPVAALRRTTWIAGFVDAAHFEDARVCAERMKLVEPDTCKTPAELNERLARRFDGR